MSDRNLIMPDRCGSDLHCWSAHSECRSACLYCQSAVLHCRSAMAPETSLPECIFALPERVLIMSEHCGSDLHFQSAHSECRSACLYC
ncbi:hypothetical protein AMTRI_Chr13g121700 [Amborella trichopoda]